MSTLKWTIWPFLVISSGHHLSAAKAWICTQRLPIEWWDPTYDLFCEGMDEEYPSDKRLCYAPHINYHLKFSSNLVLSWVWIYIIQISKNLVDAILEYACNSCVNFHNVGGLLNYYLMRWSFTRYPKLFWISNIN